MKPVISPKMMQTYDQLTCKEEGITSFELMMRAAKALSKQFLSDHEVDAIRTIAVVAGMGNNGGDGLIMGHLLKTYGYDITVFCVGDSDKMREETKRALALHDSYHVIESLKDIDRLTQALKDTDMIIDALFGLGLSRDVEGIYCEVIDVLNAQNNAIISIDFPSGIDPYNGSIRKRAVCANETYVMQSYKYGNLLNDALDYHGDTTIIDIGVKIASYDGSLIDYNEVDSLHKARMHNSHKYNYGALMIIGGSKTMMGAPNLAALAALRSGAGLVTIAYDDTAFPYRVMPNMEVMHRGYQTGRINEILEKTDVIAFGVGLGKENPNHKRTLKTVLESDIPMVIDADGLYYYGQLKDDVRIDKPVILTPHLGELLQLLECDKVSFNQSWTTKLKAFVNKYHLTIVLKGPVTVGVTDEHMVFSPYGTPGMATAGSGDVLTGIMASRLGQDKPVEKAIKEALILHGLSGEYVANHSNDMSVIASDLIEALKHIL